MIFKLYKWYQVVQSIIFNTAFEKVSNFLVTFAVHLWPGLETYESHSTQCFWKSWFSFTRLAIRGKYTRLGRFTVIVYSFSEALLWRNMLHHRMKMGVRTPLMDLIWIQCQPDQCQHFSWIFSDKYLQSFKLFYRHLSV